MKKYLIRNKKETVINITLICFCSLLQVLTAVCLTFSTNAVLELNLKKFLMYISINLLLWIILIIFNKNQVVYEAKLTQKISVQLRNNVIDNLIGSSYKERNANKIGTYLSKLTNDIASIESLAIKNFFALFSNGTAIIFSSVALFLYNFWLLLIVVVLLIIMTNVPKLFTKKIEDVTNNLSKSNAKYVEKFKDYLSGFDVFYYLNKRQLLKKLTQVEQEKLVNAKILFSKENADVQSIVMFINIFSQMIVDLLTGVLAVTGYVQLGAISTTGNLAATIFNSCAQISTQYIQLKSTKDIFKAFDRTAVIAGKENNIENNFSFQKSIHIENLSYSINDKKIISSLNLTIEKNKKYILLGESGSGKSTLLKILAGQIIDYQGDVFIDGINLREIQNKYVSNNVQYIDQNVYLFNTSIRNNLTMWNSEQLLPDTLEKIVKDYQLNFFESLDDYISENGSNLSGGQKQRIALARSLFNKKDIILMDESTSSLDAKTASFIESNLVSKMDKTIIMVTHKISDEVKSKFDEILYLNELQENT